jgi:hypothetical protein|tara:strand:- start:278 stop:460 length:183 start_codon:yes stop_codon:yes gene_type:complete
MFKIINMEKKAKKPETVTKTFKGIVINFFKVKEKSYNIGDEYKTSSKDSYNILLKSKRIK